ncbi:MFS transporter [Actinoplanes sp. NPDC051494]|uniref:MFS transporter n=1 Tax=Actinoplanes sp. NPDC051494 TaxID=3363907 RepID=UPI00378D1755
MNVLWWLAGLGLSLIADQIYFIALSWAAVQVAEPAQVGLILAAGSIPRLLVLLVGGALSDRIGAKKLALVSDTSRTLVLAAAAVLLVATGPSPLLLILVSVVFGVLDALLLPAVGAMPARLVPADQLVRLQGMRMTVQRAGLVAGAPLAGYLVAHQGIAAAFGCTAVLLAVSVGTLAATRLLPAPATPDATAPQRLTSDVADGLRYVRGHRLLPALLLVSAVTEFAFTGPVNTGLPLLAAARGWGSAGVGWILGGFGLGAALIALALAVLGRLPRPGLCIAGGAALMAGAVAGIGTAPALPWAVAAATVLGLGAGVAASLTGALTLATTRADQLGRVMSVFSVATFGTIPLSYGLTGLLTGRYGPGPTFVLGGAIAAAGAATALRAPTLRRAILPGAGAPGSTPIDIAECK